MKEGYPRGARYERAWITWRGENSENQFRIIERVGISGAFPPKNRKCGGGPGGGGIAEEGGYPDRRRNHVSRTSRASPYPRLLPNFGASVPVIFLPGTVPEPGQS